MQPLGVHHVAIDVDDVDEAVAFYTGVLGLTLRPDRPDVGIAGAWLDAGAQQVHLLAAPVPPTLGQHFALLVDDLDAVVAELRGRGLDVRDPSELPASRQSVVTDPSGNVVELHQRR